MAEPSSLVEEEGLEGELLRLARFLYTSNTFTINTWPWIVGIAATLLVGYFYLQNVNPISYWSRSTNVMLDDGYNYLLARRKQWGDQPILFKRNKRKYRKDDYAEDDYYYYDDEPAEFKDKDYHNARSRLKAKISEDINDVFGNVGSFVDWLQAGPEVNRQLQLAPAAKTEELVLPQIS